MGLVARIGVAGLLLAGVAGCATTARAPTAEVTRFYLTPSIARGTVVVEAEDARAQPSLAGQATQRAVADELARNGFAPAAGRGGAAFVAVVGLTQRLRPAIAGGGNGRPSVGFGLGGASGGYGGGVGGGVGLSIPLGGRRRPRDVSVDELSVRLRRVSDATVVWEGRAVAEVPVGGAAAGPGAAAFLARALFAEFPGRSGVPERFPPRRR